MNTLNVFMPPNGCSGFCRARGCKSHAPKHIWIGAAAPAHPALAVFVHPRTAQGAPYIF